MKLSSLFKNSSQNSSSSTTTTTTTTTSPWPWSLPTCGKPKTLSFRLEKNQHNIYNSTFHLDDINDTTSCSFDDLFSEIDETSSSSTTTINGQDCIEKVIKGLRLEKERLFFEPEETSSILDFQENKIISITSSNINNVVDEGDIISFVPMGLDSNDPFVDFRKSMEEMVEAYEIKDWENLEELLTCYLKVNCKSNHGYIVGAFVDLLVNLATFSDNNNNVGVDIGAGVGAGVDESTIIMTTIDEEQQCLSSSTTTTTTTTNHSFTSPLSFCSSSCSTSSSITSTSACLSLLLEEDEVIQTKKH
ncbi:transcription repressor OFP15 [Solanum pennellii]|uniref:Transcription repressor n=1 Tax=Solanum pennellii TaxID=28526 RepID=A0ABM1GBX4_SOLPN|nr:transcription repressor OFP15 [Solanum pennellii]